MHVLESLHRNVKTIAMPSAMVVGALLCRPVSALEAASYQMMSTPSWFSILAMILMSLPY